MRPEISAPTSTWSRGCKVPVALTVTASGPRVTACVTYCVLDPRGSRRNARTITARMPAPIRIQLRRDSPRARAPIPSRLARSVSGDDSWKRSFTATPAVKPISVPHPATSSAGLIAGAFRQDEEVHPCAARLAGQEGGFDIALHGALFELGAVGLRHVITQAERDIAVAVPDNEALAGHRRPEAGRRRIGRHHPRIRKTEAQVAGQCRVRRGDCAGDKSRLAEGVGIARHRPVFRAGAAVMGTRLIHPRPHAEPDEDAGEHGDGKTLVAAIR